MKQHKHRLMQGQALVEFALIITVLLMMIFLIIESARLMWGWGTVQNAAREGARYATTGRNDGTSSVCPVDGMVKFENRICPNSVNDTDQLRTASIVAVAHEGMTGLPLNETSFTYEDEYYYNIEVWGVDTDDQLRQDFGGAPSNSVVVRVTYRVPIITPFFRPIIDSVPLFGQVTMTNENFGQLGNIQTESLVAALPELPTPGPTPTDTPTPTNTPTNTPGATPTSTNTPTNTPTATREICETEFVAEPVAGNFFVLIMGEPGETVTITDRTTGQVLGSQAYLERRSDQRRCDGFADFQPPPLNIPLQAGHIIEARSSDGSIDTRRVLEAPPTVTPTASNTPVPTLTPTHTPTPGPTSTPSGPFIYLSPDCQGGPNVRFTIFGFNWPFGEGIDLTWVEEGRRETERNATLGPTFQVTWEKNGLGLSTGQGTSIYQVIAQSGQDSYTAVFKVPCDDATPVPATATPTATPAPADLIVVGPPQLVSTRPIVAYRPVQYAVTISNTGDIDISKQFFVDLYFDPAPLPSPGDLSIPITKSVGYMAVSSLAGGASRVLTITAPLGFANLPPTHNIYGMVDSVEQVTEDSETNNISQNTVETQVTPAPTPTATPQAGPGDAIGGQVLLLTSVWEPQYRVQVWLIDENTQAVVGAALTDQSGFYLFPNVDFSRPGSSFTVVACLSVDNRPYSGTFAGIPFSFLWADILLLPGPCSL